MSYTYRTGKYYGSNCHIFEFNPKELRFDVTVGIPNKLERLSTIEEPKKASGDTAIAKINGGFFAMNGKSEYIGTFVDSGLYYSMAANMYPTAVFTKDYKLILDQHPTQSKLAEYQKTAFWAIGCPWLLLKDGRINNLYSKEELIATFGHPYQKAPRTMMGQRKDGTIVWVVVDGRKALSPGYTIINQCNLMIDLECDIAFNLDGGGSSEMIVDGIIKNKPSDGCERYIGTAFVAYKPAAVATKTPTVASMSGTVTARSGLNIRKAANTSAEKLTALPKDTKVTILNNGKKENNFYKISYNGIVGYAYSTFISIK